MSELERSEERDAALRAMLPHIAAHGWTTTALRAGLAEREASAQAASYLFSGPLDMIEAYLDFADRRMAAAAADLPQTRLSERIRAIVALRFAQAREERDASRRAAAVLALPTSAAVSTRSLARTVDAIWHAAGDEAADFSWYTKRATLAGVYAATLLFWLRLDSYADPGDGQTLSFLDRRLAEIARVAKLKARLQRQIESLLPAGWRGSTIPEPVHG